MRQFMQNRRLKQLKSEKAERRKRAAEKLGNSKDARAVQPLVATLKDDDKNVRKAAAEALVKIGASAVQPLVAVFKDKDKDLRQAAAAALGEIGAPAIQALIVALKNNDKDVREAVEQFFKTKAAEILSLRSKVEGLRSQITALNSEMSKIPTRTKTETFTYEDDDPQVWGNRRLITETYTTKEYAPEYKETVAALQARLRVLKEALEKAEPKLRKLKIYEDRGIQKRA